MAEATVGERRAGYHTGFITAAPILRPHTGHESSSAVPGGPHAAYGVLVLRSPSHHVSQKECELLDLLLPSISAALAAVGETSAVLSSEQALTRAATQTPTPVVLRLDKAGKLAWTNYPFHLPGAQLSHAHAGDLRTRSFHVDPRGVSEDGAHGRENPLSLPPRASVRPGSRPPGT